MSIRKMQAYISLMQDYADIDYNDILIASREDCVTDDWLLELYHNYKVIMSERDTHDLSDLTVDINFLTEIKRAIQIEVNHEEWDYLQQLSKICYDLDKNTNNSYSEFVIQILENYEPVSDIIYTLAVALEQVLEEYLQDGDVDVSEVQRQRAVIEKIHYIRYQLIWKRGI